MAMSGIRMGLFVIGLLLVVAAGLLFFFKMGLDAWVPLWALGAGILLLVGLMVLQFADRAPDERRTGRRGGDRDSGGDVTVVNK